MKRITYIGGSIVTSNSITSALLDYVTSVADSDNSVAVDVTVLDENDETSVHTLTLSPTSQFDVVDVDVEGMTEEDEATRFPLPEMPMIGITGTVETTGDAGQTAKDFNLVANEIDNGLGSIHG
ncbi:hypothetical protein E3T34_08555 [Cryobacterium sp. TMT1-62]|uniref:hypothetical protein n=1 Tax=unclassified Cryobacterium TaxID=2649013 RepID=UPI001069A05E|nr:MULTISPECIES: hypothetical protein [unclassified Cryobacterium]TFC35556.1 hypothetical protein E3O28_10350 [Cryobacterium sp. TMT2-14]TFD32488.1 hypothetical protein E3T34_08555 [Cryobacterium sp. TMT1-62]